jgi:L-lactate dehydrogenase complex protein LldF
MRGNLRPAFLNADIGITGANVAIAETGSFLIETNEGNGRLVSGIPPIYVSRVVSAKRSALRTSTFQ